MLKSFLTICLLTVISFATTHAYALTLSCSGTVTVGEGEPSPLKFSIDQIGQAQPPKLFEERTRFETVLDPIDSNHIRIDKQSVWMMASHTPAEGRFDINVYDDNIAVPGDSKPRIFAVGGSHSGDDAIPLRFEYEQWQKSSPNFGEKRISHLFQFKCYVEP